MSKMLVTYGRTESGDDLPLVIWGSIEPSPEQIAKVLKKLMPYEFEGGEDFTHPQTVVAVNGWETLKND